VRPGHPAAVNIGRDLSHATIRIDPDHVERNVRVLHPERRHASRAKVEQHAAVQFQDVASAQTHRTLIRCDRHSTRSSLLPNRTGMIASPEADVAGTVTRGSGALFEDPSAHAVTARARTQTSVANNSRIVGA